MLVYVWASLGSWGQQVAAASGTDTAPLRAVVKKAGEAKQVRAKGKGRQN